MCTGQYLQPVLQLYDCTVTANVYSLYSITLQYQCIHVALETSVQLHPVCIVYNQLKLKVQAEAGVRQQIHCILIPLSLVSSL